MRANLQHESVYRFAAFGVRGTITLKAEGVHSRVLSYLGWWEQTIPLDLLNPNYITLTKTPPIWLWLWILALLFSCLGVYGIIWGIWLYHVKLVSALMFLCGTSSMWYLYRRRKTEWIMFVARGTQFGVQYTRQGPDERECDTFTQQLTASINSWHAGKEPNKLMNRRPLTLLAQYSGRSEFSMSTNDNMNARFEMRELQRLFDQSPQSDEFLQMRRRSKWGERIREEVIDGIKRRDPTAIEDGILFLEEDLRYFRTGYFKATIARKLRQVELSQDQRERLLKIILDATHLANVGPECIEYARLASVIATPAFFHDVTILYRQLHGWSRRRCERILARFGDADRSDK